jgi:hypothetical protein
VPIMSHVVDEPDRPLQDSQVREIRQRASNHSDRQDSEILDPRDDAPQIGIAAVKGAPVLDAHTLSLVALAVGALLPISQSRAGSVPENTAETVFQIDFHVSEEALRPYIPAGWNLARNQRCLERERPGGGRKSDQEPQVPRVGRRDRQAVRRQGTRIESGYFYLVPEQAGAKVTAGRRQGSFDCTAARCAAGHSQ